MAKGFKHGAGGTDALNFKVVGGTEQPENPKENTVWVNTDTAISGWVFSPEEPAGHSEGLVWIGLGAASHAPFNALKKNGLFVYPLSCKQYVSGAWEIKTAYVYKAGTWEQVRTVKEYLIQGGVIDMDAYPHTAYNESGDQANYKAENGVDYSGSPALKLTMSNGGLVTHKFSGVTVPEWASTMMIHYYLLASFNYDPVFRIGGASVSISRGSAYKIEEGTAQIDVEAIAGTTVEFKFVAKGYSGCGYSYIGNAWFE